jgi:hypothetical protein
MQSKIINYSLFFYILIVIVFFTKGCTKKTDLENQITIKINSIDSKTKKPRVNTFDTIDVRISKFGFPMRKYVKIAEYVTDSMGSVNVTINKNEENHFILGGKNIYGAIEYYKGELKDNQEINIEVISFEER